MTTERPLRVALIGPGRIATAHLEAIRSAKDMATLVAVAGLPHERARTAELATRYRAERSVDDPQRIIEADDIDAVVLTVPNHVHAPLCIALAEAGKHVLVEKPLTTSLPEADQAIAAAAAADRILMVGQCRRFFEGAVQARKAVAGFGGPVSLVRLLGVFAERAETDWWKSSAAAGGLALGLNGPHVIDSMIWMIGARPITVYARTRRLRELWEGEDEVALVVDFDDGSIATATISLNSRPAVNEMWINGANGSLQLSDDRNLSVNGLERVREEVTPYIAGDASFNAQFQEFAAAIVESREPRSSAAEARQIVEVMEAAHRSAQEGRPVDLDVVSAR